MLLTHSWKAAALRAGRGPGWGAGARLALVAALLAAAPQSPAAITGLCPDGSLFIVQRPESIPCRDAKQVEPGEVPPLRPQLLPKPYTWQVYNEGADPNNPYNLIDAARQVRSLKGRPPELQGEGADPGAPAPNSPSAMPVAPLEASTLGLSEEELRDLFLIVELSQQRAPASLVRETADGQEAFAVALAHSAAFEDHLCRSHPQASELAGASVLLFSVVAKQADPFYGNFTFTQDHLAFSPDPSNPLQLGLLQGRLGELEVGEVVLGYVVLPDRMSLHRSMGLYWNDRHADVTFQPD